MSTSLGHLQSVLSVLHVDVAALQSSTSCVDDRTAEVPEGIKFVKMTGNRSSILGPETSGPGAKKQDEIVDAMTYIILISSTRNIFDVPG